ncbi:hypothetical protein C4D60_Mb03t21350 [Musa balbisiana]|uniref:Uncharacterized protein n=1 Tax=Musa balbisiana TaxID=52838 RepID=A0A4S8JDZ2_MUSBA|nr:hypothetical protein C4D60_Mb03t21350 [Musa balbisiana]
MDDVIILHSIPLVTTDLWSIQKQRPVPSPAMARQRKAFLVGDRGFVLEEFTEQYKATSIPDYVEKIIEVSDRRVTFQIKYLRWLPIQEAWYYLPDMSHHLSSDSLAIFFGVIGKVDIVAVVPSAGSATAARVEASGIGALREAPTHGWWQKRIIILHNEQKY